MGCAVCSDSLDTRAQSAAAPAAGGSMEALEGAVAKLQAEPVGHTPRVWEAESRCSNVPSRAAVRSSCMHAWMLSCHHTEYSKRAQATITKHSLMHAHTSQELDDNTRSKDRGVCAPLQ